MAENSLDARIQATIENALVDGARLSVEDRAILIRRRLQANGLCASVHRVNEDDDPMSLRPLDPP